MAVQYIASTDPTLCGSTLKHEGRVGAADAGRVNLLCDAGLAEGHIFIYRGIWLLK